MSPDSSQKVPVSVVFQGGGVRGMAYAGALVHLGKYFDFVNVGGSSAGAIVAALLAAKYSTDEIKLLLDSDFSRFLDGHLFPLYGLWREYSFYRGDRLHDWLHEKLHAKGIDTFASLPLDRNLRVVVSDIVKRRLCVCSRENTLDQSVAEAVRMSAGIPFFFRPLRFNVDGGMLSNFPTTLFNDSPLPVIGLTLISDAASRSAPREPKGLMAFARALFDTMLEARDKADAASQARLSVIRISTGDICSTDFDLKEPARKELYLYGENAALKWLQASGQEYLTSKDGVQAGKNELAELVEMIKSVSDRLPPLEPFWGGSRQLTSKTVAELEAADAQLQYADDRRVPCDPRDLATAFLQVALYWRWANQERVAIDRLKRATIIDPKYAEAWLELGESRMYLAARTNGSEAKERLLISSKDCLATARGLAGESFQLLHDEGWLADEQGNFGLAVEKYSKALALKEKLNPRDLSYLPGVYFNYACALAKKGDAPAALEMLKYLQSTPELLAQAEKDEDLALVRESDKTRDTFAELLAKAKEEPAT